MTHSELFNGIPSGYELVQGRKTFNQRITLTGLTEQLRIFNPNIPNSPTQFTVDSTGRLTVTNGIGITLTGVSSTLTIGGGFNFNQLVTIASNLTITSVGTFTYGTTTTNFNTGFASTAVSGYQMRGSTVATVFGISAGSRAVSLGGGAVGSVFAVATSSITITTPGKCPIVASAAFKPFTIVETAGTASLCATVYIDGVPSGSVSSSYALLVSGSSRFDGTITASLNGAASTPAFIANGTIFTGGTTTTTKPLVLIEPAGTTSTGWNPSGSAFGVNAASGFIGDLMNLQIAGTSGFKVVGNSSGAPAAIVNGSGGTITMASNNGSGFPGIIASSVSIGLSGAGGMIYGRNYPNTTFYTNISAATNGFTVINNNSPSAYGNSLAITLHGTIRAVIGSGTDISGSNLYLIGGLGTGTGSTGDVVIRGANTGSTGTTLATELDRVTFKADGRVGFGTPTPALTSIVDVTSTTQGFLFPRMTTTQKNAITSPAEGLIVYDLTLHKLCVYTGATWETITSL